MRRLFGSKSEKIDEAQLKLLLEDGLPPEPPGKAPASSDADAPGEAAEVGGAKADKARRGRGGHRSRITGLDRLEVELTEVIPALVKEDPEAFERRGEEVTDQLDVTPPRYFIRRVVRPVFRRKVARLTAGGGQRQPPRWWAACRRQTAGSSAGERSIMITCRFIVSGIFRQKRAGYPRDLIVIGSCRHRTGAAG
ncbi:MAG: hypothetical protein H7A53_10945 [Akkermansiaceae bacterium]|nr:hypothetical protein [Akkermansiaceae bacterium]